MFPCLIPCHFHIIEVRRGLHFLCSTVHTIEEGGNLETVLFDYIHIRHIATGGVIYDSAEREFAAMVGSHVKTLVL